MEYWRLRPESMQEQSEMRYIDGFRERFDSAVSCHLASDVQLGAFLSGGVDSSGMVAAMARQGPTRIKTFSIGFPDEYAAFDERKFARIVAKQYDTDHQELVVEPNIRDTLDTLGSVFDEPMGDSGAVPNFIVCQLARQHLTVALSGLGGDRVSRGIPTPLGYARSRMVPEDSPGP